MEERDELPRTRLWESALHAVRIPRKASFAVYVLLMGASAMAGLAKNLAFAQVLGVSAYGYYGVVDLIVSYGIYAGSLGLLEALNRELPTLLGSGLRDKAARLGRAATAALIVLVAVMGAPYFALVALTLDAGSAAWLAWISGGVLAAANIFYLYVILQLLARQRSVLQAAIMLLKNAVAVVLGYALALSWGLAGVVAGELASILLAIAVANLISACIPAPDFREIRALVPLFRLGIPMMLGSLTSNISRNVDRVVVLAALGVAFFAQYSFAMLIVLAMLVTVNTVGLYVTPRICFGFGAGVPLDGYRRQLDVIVIGVLGVAALAYVPFILTAPTVLSSVFADFRLGSDLMRITYAGAVLQIALVYQAILVAAGAAAVLFRQSLIVAITSAAASVVAWAAGADILAFAWIFVGARLLAAALLWTASRSAAASTPPSLRPDRYAI